MAGRISPELHDPEIDCLLIRAQEMARYGGTRCDRNDAGLTGRDWVVESGLEVVAVSDLIYARRSGKVRWVLAVPEDSPWQRAEDLRENRCHGTGEQSRANYFHQQNVDVRVEFSWGATEVKPPMLADAIVEVTETGSSLQGESAAHSGDGAGVEHADDREQEACGDPDKRGKIDNLALMFCGAMEAQDRVGLMLNVRNRSAAVLAVLPALKKPTISQLSDGEWVAVNTVIEE